MSTCALAYCGRLAPQLPTTGRLTVAALQRCVGGRLPHRWVGGQPKVIIQAEQLDCLQVSSLRQRGQRGRGWGLVRHKGIDVCLRHGRLNAWVGRGREGGQEVMGRRGPHGWCGPAARLQR